MSQSPRIQIYIYMHLYINYVHSKKHTLTSNRPENTIVKAIKTDDFSFYKETKETTFYPSKHFMFDSLYSS